MLSEGAIFISDGEAYVLVCVRDVIFVFNETSYVVSALSVSTGEKVVKMVDSEDFDIGAFIKVDEDCSK